ncbi:MAG: ATP-binding protein, partial [Tepidimonas taiwanensis]|nr:ATP-binding protein [Tepidimonas taiwanensis]
LGGVLLLAVAVQVELGLRPLRALRAAVERVRRGEQDHLQGTFPREVVPLVEDFNRLLAHDAQVVERARRMAGNLAHAVKTPLAVMTALAEDAQLPPAALRQQLLEQIGAMRQQVDWQLRRARAAAAAGAARRTPVVPVVQGLLRLMEKVHAAREGRPSVALSLQVPPGDTPSFAGEAEDLREMVGNLLDNACKWAATRVRVDIAVADGRLCIQVEDDGPGLSAEQCQQVLQRGVRADERVPGAGLGLDIVREVAALYGADLRLERGAWGGLCTRLSLPLG